MVIEEKTIELKSFGTTTLQFTTYVGGYRLGGVNGLQINFTTKPNWFHRKMMKLCLDWEWIDNK
jgi:hypothetical protein